MNIGVFGAGTWGTALSRLLSINGHDVTVWSPIHEEVEQLSQKRTHPNLPGMTIPENILYTDNIQDACENKDLLLCAVPSVFVRGTIAKAAKYINSRQIIVDVAKGIEKDTLMTMSQVIRDELDRAGVNGDIKIVALTGPTHAEEVAKDIPTMIVAACTDKNTAEFVQDVFMSPCMRVYTNFDVEGVELCGAIKNIIALGTGIARGLGYGDNTKAALMTRGLAEIEALGRAMGCYEQTFSGLAGLGDLIVTATSEHSRNNRCGFLIGSGETPENAVKKVGMVVEGINALPAVMSLSKRYGVEMPISSAVNDIINNGKDAEEAVGELMERKKKQEPVHNEADYQIRNAVMDNLQFGSSMKRVITYGTFDMLHYGHINFLKKAKALGDYLIVGLSTDDFNSKEKHKESYFDYEKRKTLLESLRYVDLVIPEENWEQKVSDIAEYCVDTFVIGDKWKGKFDYLKEQGVEVIYLPRTPEISSTQIKNDLQ